MATNSRRSPRRIHISTFILASAAQPRNPARPNDRSGHVHVALAELKPDAAHDIAYLCGNPDMVDQAFALLKEAGLADSAHPPREVHFVALIGDGDQYVTVTVILSV